ncbi:hypothetical protein QZH41_000146 [Actinostola sp. cb2023]|nr:hypothetical protein QZH41_000146 [Actinostola sp. cb2023]
MVLLNQYIVDKLQSVQNAGARVITCSHKYDHITPILIQLHWLPVEERIKFKMLLLTYKAMNKLVRSYISDLITRYSPKRTLRSSSDLLLNHVNFNLKSYGRRAFSVAAPQLWNNLPPDVTDDFTVFK